MKIDKAELALKIKKLKNVVPIKTNRAILQGILVQDGYMIASNMELTIKVKIEGAEGESFIIPVKAFDLINNLPDGEINIEAGKYKNAHIITISAAKIKNKYQVMDPALFPLPGTDNEGEEEFTIDSEMLLTSMKRVCYAIASEAANPTMKALYLQAADGMLNFVGSDGHVLAWDKAAFEGEFKLLIPKVTVDKLVSIGLSGKVSIRHNTTSAVFVSNDYEIHTRIISGEYFKYPNLFKELGLHTVIARIVLLEAMTRAKMCTDERSPVRFEIDGNILNLSIKDNITDYHETVELQESMGEPLTIGFDAKLVLETLKAFDCENVGLSFERAKMPMIVEAEDSDFKSIVLPVTIN